MWKAGALRRVNVAGDRQQADRSAGTERALFSAGVLSANPDNEPLRKFAGVA
jgi:hypothetical protein